MRKRYCINCKYITGNNTIHKDYANCEHPANIKWNVKEDFFRRLILIDGYFLRPREINNDNKCKFYKTDWVFLILKRFTKNA